MSFSGPCKLLKTRWCILSSFTDSPPISVSIHKNHTCNSSHSCRNAGKHHFATSKIVLYQLCTHSFAMCLYVKHLKHDVVLGTLSGWHRDLDYMIFTSASQYLSCSVILCEKNATKNPPNNPVIPALPNRQLGYNTFQTLTYGEMSPWSLLKLAKHPQWGFELLSELFLTFPSLLVFFFICVCKQ